MLEKKNISIVICNLIKFRIKYCRQKHVKFIINGTLNKLKKMQLHV